MVVGKFWRLLHIGLKRKAVPTLISPAEKVSSTSHAIRRSIFAIFHFFICFQKQQQIKNFLFTLNSLVEQGSVRVEGRLFEVKGIGVNNFLI